MKGNRKRKLPKPGMVKLSLAQCRVLLRAHFDRQPLPAKFVRHLKRLGWIDLWTEAITAKGVHQLQEMGV